MSYQNRPDAEAVKIQVTLTGVQLAAVRSATGSRRPLSYGVRILIDAGLNHERTASQMIAREAQLTAALAQLVALATDLKDEIATLKAERLDWLAAAESGLTNLLAVAGRGR